MRYSRHHHPLAVVMAVLEPAAGAAEAPPEQPEVVLQGVAVCRAPEEPRGLRRASAGGLAVAELLKKSPAPELE